MQPQSPVVAVVVVPVVVEVLRVSVDVSRISSSEHWKSNNSAKRVRPFVKRERVFEMNVINYLLDECSLLLHLIEFRSSDSDWIFFRTLQVNKINVSILDGFVKANN